MFWKHNTNKTHLSKITITDSREKENSDLELFHKRSKRDKLSIAFKGYKKDLFVLPLVTKTSSYMKAIHIYDSTLKNKKHT